MKNNAIRLDLKSRKASSPNVSISDTDLFFTIRHCGSVMQYANNTMLNNPETRNCIYVYWNLCAFSSSEKKKEPSSHVAQLTNHIVAIKPTVPITRIGGNA